ncbi:helix-turn-helix domain-containing protein [bacterium]|nr:MAG: helix-turn-helix domain-containing protein [bacterium]
MARYRAGEKIKDLAVSYKIHRSTVMAHLRRGGELKHKGWTEETTAEARKLRAAGLTIVEIAARLGRPPSTVQRRLNQ